MRRNSGFGCSRVAIVIAFTAASARAGDAPAGSPTVHAVIPGCCSSILWALIVMNGSNGQVQREFTSPGGSSGGFVGATSLAITKDGKQAVVVSNLNPVGRPPAVEVDFVNLSTGKITTVLTVNASDGTAAVNPQSGLLYVAYTDTSTSLGYVEIIDPATAMVTRNAQAQCYAILAGANELYCTTSTGISVLAANTLSPIGSLAISELADDLALSPDGSVLYVAYYQSVDPPQENVDFVDTAALQVSQSSPSAREFPDSPYRPMVRNCTSVRIARCWS